MTAQIFGMNYGTYVTAPRRCVMLWPGSVWREGLDIRERDWALYRLSEHEC